MLLTWNLSQLYFNVTTKMVDKNFQNCSYRDDDVTNYVNFFEKLCEKWNMFFSKIDLVAAGKKDFQDLFSSFESQDNTNWIYLV